MQILHLRVAAGVGASKQLRFSRPYPPPKQRQQQRIPLLRPRQHIALLRDAASLAAVGVFSSNVTNTTFRLDRY